VVGGCTCSCCLERSRVNEEERSSDAGRSSTWDVRVVYADSETRLEFEFGDVELMKRCRRRKSRLHSKQHRRPVVVLRDTADRYNNNNNNNNNNT